MLSWLIPILVTAAAIIGYNERTSLRVTPSLAGAKVVIVGASSGIGRSLAHSYAQQGAELILCARREALLAEVGAHCQALTSKVHILVGDITERKTQDRLRTLVEDKFAAHVDYLVLNAGAISVKPILDLWGVDAAGKRQPSSGNAEAQADGALKSIMDVNVAAPIAVAGRLLPVLIASESRVVVVSSVSGLIAAPTRSLYSASKHALTGYFNAFRAELDKFNVSVTIVYPGTVDTELRQSAVDYSAGDSSVPAGSTKGKLSPDACARQIVRAAALREPTLITPFAYRVSVALYSVAPRLVDFLAKKKYGFA